MSLFYCALVYLSLHSFASCVGFDALGTQYPDSTRLATLVTNFNPHSYRLPTNLKPTEYHLFFVTIFGNKSFFGNTSIRFDVVAPTNEIVLNAGFDTLRADSFLATVGRDGGSHVKITNTTIDKEHQMIRFHLEKTLEKQEELFINISYDGILSTDTYGFFDGSYPSTDSQGNTISHKLALTQFEGAYARRAFPCFDEPSYRANFTIYLARAHNQMSMSNMGLHYSYNTNIMNMAMVVDAYKTSPVMPTYLVAFGVGDLSTKSDNGTVRIFSPSNNIHDTALALSVAQPILDFIGNFTNIPYALKKMDIVVAPVFFSGAMENWGLNIFQNYLILYNPQEHNFEHWFVVVSIIAHEFAHQWFGDLVTPQWWDYVWLNEAFAKYFEYWIPIQMFPDKNIGWTKFIVDELQSALEQDVDTEFKKTRPMTSPLYTPDQINNIFVDYEYLIYKKGGSVLRMMEDFLTAPVWRDGLHRYLKSNAYKTGTPEELFTALQAAANDANIAEASRVTSTLTSWTTQPGYPLVKLQKERPSIYTLTQSPYELHDTSMRWSIPVTYTWQEEAQSDPSKAARTLLYNTKETVTINTTGWVIINVDQIGYFRVNYDDSNWVKISAQLKTNHSVIGANNRAQLLDDAFHLARTGQLNYSIVMSLTEYLAKETEYAPWNSYFTNIEFLLNQFHSTSAGENLMKHARNVIRHPFKYFITKATSTNLSYWDPLTFASLSKFSCDIHLPECVEWSSEAFQKWTEDPYSITPHVRQAVICTQLRLDRESKQFQTVLDYFLHSNNKAERSYLKNVMHCATNPASIHKFKDNFLERTSKEPHISLVNALLNDATIDQDLRTMLQTSVLPQVKGSQTWAQTPQAHDLKSLLDNQPVVINI